MTQDFLKAATKALSESGHEQQGARFTRERLMASLHEKNRRRKGHFAVLLPLAAIFVGSTAFATVSGKFDGFVTQVLEVVGVTAADEPVTSQPTAAPARRAGARPAPVPRVSSQTASAPRVEPAAEKQTLEVDTATVQVDSAPVRATDSGTGLQGSSPRDAAYNAPRRADADAAHRLYRSAHDAHFKRGDPSRALAGYDAYLAREPQGRFAVDARYNRALCLVRLGRRAEARPILRSFALGSFGGYRRADAEKLLEALDAAADSAP